MKIILQLFFVTLLLLPVSMSAQTNREEGSASPSLPGSQSYGDIKPAFKDRISVGGSFALSFGNITYIGVSPVVGYSITPKWTAGLGMSYYYWRDNVYNYENSIYGGLVFTRYIVYKGLFLEGNFELNNQYAYYTNPSEREWIPSLLLGGGYSSSMGENSAFYISVLYDVIQNINSQYYGIPVIRAGFGFGL